MKAKIDIYANPTSDEVVATFEDTDDLITYADEHNTPADHVAINGMILLGWDELNDFLHIK